MVKRHLPAIGVFLLGVVLIGSYSARFAPAPQGGPAPGPSAFQDPPATFAQPQPSLALQADSLVWSRPPVRLPGGFVALRVGSEAPGPLTVAAVESGGGEGSLEARLPAFALTARPVASSARLSMLRARPLSATDLASTVSGRLVIEAAGGWSAPAYDVIPVVRTDTIRYREEAYRGKVLVGLLDSLGPREPDSLPTPIEVQLFVHGGVVRPDVVPIRHTNPPYLWAEIEMDPAPIDSFVRLTVWTPSTPSGQDVRIPVRRSSLALDAVPETLQGFGLERSSLVVEVPQEVSSESVQVVLSARGSRPIPRIVRASRSSPGEAVLRSVGLGETTVEATSSHPRLASNPVRIDFVFPWWFLAAAVLGGLAGGLVGMYQEEEWTGRRLAGTFLTGVVMAVLYVAGINLFVNPLVDLDVPYVLDEVFVFALAALGAWVTLPSLKRWLVLLVRWFRVWLRKRRAARSAGEKE